MSLTEREMLDALMETPSTPSLASAHLAPYFVFPKLATDSSVLVATDFRGKILKVCTEY